MGIIADIDYYTVILTPLNNRSKTTVAIFLKRHYMEITVANNWR